METLSEPYNAFQICNSKNQKLLDLKRKKVPKLSVFLQYKLFGSERSFACFVKTLSQSFQVTMKSNKMAWQRKDFHLGFLLQTQSGTGYFAAHYKILMVFTKKFYKL